MPWSSQMHANEHPDGCIDWIGCELPPPGGITPPWYTSRAATPQPCWRYVKDCLYSPGLLHTPTLPKQLELSPGRRRTYFRSCTWQRQPYRSHSERAPLSFWETAQRYSRVGQDLLS